MDNERRSTVNIKRVVKALEKDGWKLDRQKGSHMIYKKNGKVCPLPNHKGDIPIGTLKNISRVTGVKF